MTITIHGCTDIPFDEAPDVRSIQYRLHPLDVGFDVRADGTTVDLGADGVLRVSYAAEGNARRVITGPRAAVVKRLEALGYRVARD